MALVFSTQLLSTPVTEVKVEAEPYLKKPLIVETAGTVEPIKRTLTIAGVEIIGQSNEQCVIFARRITGNAKIHGYAGNLQPETNIPSVGAVALARNYGHVAVITSILPDGRLEVEDSNWVKGAITKRIVSADSMRGFIN